MSKKNIFIITISLLLLAAIPLTLYLVRQRQTVKSKAAEPGVRALIQFVDDNGQVITETHNPHVNLRITFVPQQASAGAQQNPVPTCYPRPACLDAKPPCKIAQQLPECPATTIQPAASASAGISI